MHNLSSEFCCIFGPILYHVSQKNCTILFLQTNSVRPNSHFDNFWHKYTQYISYHKHI